MSSDLTLSWPKISLHFWLTFLTLFDLQRQLENFSAPFYVNLKYMKYFSILTVPLLLFLTLIIFLLKTEFSIKTTFFTADLANGGLNPKTLANSSGS